MRTSSILSLLVALAGCSGGGAERFAPNAPLVEGEGDACTFSVQCTEANQICVDGACATAATCADRPAIRRG